MASTWKCNTCGKVKGVTNGTCPVCGPTQTTPINEDAKVEAGFPQVEEGIVVE